ncbi:unnamed protein product [Pleuronectes platessa]|uniref:Uncharacterized protein n=1 Tax=Pleuronectes platessa TaxID=8262 RepID=A0A9N7TVT5_PLEPL|nr:unnamed protein product [Pleuronectes platessa]
MSPLFSARLLPSISPRSHLWDAARPCPCYNITDSKVNELKWRGEGERRGSLRGASCKPAAVEPLVPQLPLCWVFCLHLSAYLQDRLCQPSCRITPVIFHRAERREAVTERLQ